MQRPAAIIAIPARNEENFLPVCLQALALQTPAVPFTVVVFANNCDDQTAEAARAIRSALPYRLLVEESWLPAPCRTAGHARRRAMDLAADLAGEGDLLLLSTDADARPRPDWLANALAHVAAGADAVAGRAIMAGADAAALPATVRDRLRREAYLARLMDRIAAAIDHIPWDPWPRHCGHWGANFAVRSAIYKQCGGVPEVPLAEDRAFFARLDRHNARIRHAEDCVVEVSARLNGRAPGGMADVLDRRTHGDDPICDALIEPLAHAMRRYRMRRSIRENGAELDAPRAARRLGIAVDQLRHAMLAGDHGESWAQLLSCAPALREVRVPHERLASQIAAAKRVIQRLCPGEPLPTPSDEETLV